MVRQTFSLIIIGAALTLACAEKNNSASSQKGLEEFKSYKVIKTKPSVITNIVSGEKRKSAILYYAVDTEEPLMQLAVDFEVRQLRATCQEKNTNINWVAFLNSHYVNNNKKYLKCVAGKYSEESLEIGVKPYTLEDRIKIIADPKHDPSAVFTDQRSLLFKLKHSAALNSNYNRYPLAHPQVMSDIMQFVSANIFNSKDYILFAHVKSHGSEELMLTGLTDEQIDNKMKRQVAALESKGLKSDLEDFSMGYAGIAADRKVNKDFMIKSGLGWQKHAKAALGETGLGETGLGETGLGETGLGETGLGETGLGETGLGETGLGETGLGETGLGETGLGETGLFANNHFGTSKEHMISIMSMEKTQGDGSLATQFGFVMLESCSSKVTESDHSSFTLGKLGNVDAYYSAKGSLWYRNIDWFTLLTIWNKNGASAETMQRLLIGWTSDLPNYVAKAEK